MSSSVERPSDPAAVFSNPIAVAPTFFCHARDLESAGIDASTLREGTRLAYTLEKGNSGKFYAGNLGDLSN
jgi:hypothetical protein